ncbi:Uncharacterised protein [uncultured archaeon]|nr:Uncharacterised protein [uncultured archaeon]
MVSVFTPLIEAAAALVPDTLNVSDELLNADVALMVSTKLAVPPAGMSTAVLGEPINVAPFHC